MTKMTKMMQIIYVYLREQPNKSLSSVTFWHCLLLQFPRSVSATGAAPHGRGGVRAGLPGAPAAPHSPPAPDTGGPGHAGTAPRLWGLLLGPEAGDSPDVDHFLHLVESSAGSGSQADIRLSYGLISMVRY